MSSYANEDSEGVISYYLTGACVNINAVSEDSKSESAIADDTSDRVISYHFNFISSMKYFKGRCGHDGKIITYRFQLNN